MNKLINQIYKHISQSNKEKLGKEKRVKIKKLKNKIKELEDEMKKLKLQLTNQSVQNNDDNDDSDDNDDNDDNEKKIIIIIIIIKNTLRTGKKCGITYRQYISKKLKENQNILFF